MIAPHPLLHPHRTLLPQGCIAIPTLMQRRPSCTYLQRCSGERRLLADTEPAKDFTQHLLDVHCAGDLAEREDGVAKLFAGIDDVFSRDSCVERSVSKNRN